MMRIVLHMLFSQLVVTEKYHSTYMSIVQTHWVGTNKMLLHERVLGYVKLETIAS